MKVKAMSKGMVVQLHLALVMAIDARLLVLDEPTLGLDILYRKQFYQNLLEDYFDENKTILITTHQIEEVEHILSDLMFIRDGKIELAASMDEVGERFTEVMVEPQHPRRKALQPLSQRTVFGKAVMLFDGAPPAAGQFGRTAHARRGRSVRRHHERKLRMKTMKWLIKREMWENKGMLLWTPIVVAAVVAILLTLFARQDAGIAEARPAIVGTITIEGQGAHADDGHRRRATWRRHARCCWACWCSSTAWARCMTNAATAACCSGNRCRFRTATVPPKPARAGRGAADHHGHRHRAGLCDAGNLHRAATARHQPVRRPAAGARPVPVAIAPAIACCRCTSCGPCRLWAGC
jgi:energy-coupling factor transporter ATP-binding protein EcfA2